MKKSHRSAVSSILHSSFKELTMSEYRRSIRVGAATVTMINVGDVRFSLGGWLIVPEAERPPYFADWLPFPIQCVHIASPGLSLLVDASFYEVDPNSPHAIPGYQPPPELPAALAEAAVRPEAIDHVVITHIHHDHINGLTRQQGDSFMPCFPNARHFLSQADWEQAQDALQKPESVESRTLGVLSSAGLLEKVDGRRDLGSGVAIIPAPGETRGHQIVRVHSGGQTLYCLGDLYHHPIEVERQEWAAQWADADLIRASRRALVEAALAEDALLIATHIDGIGRLERAGSGVIWVAA
jgi:glyoxylase-like metal-dependent hydrolase (beta-lactamase superfamily II)